MSYGQIVDGQIYGPKGLPKAFQNISGFDRMSDEQLAEFGWHPWREAVDTSQGSDLIYTRSKALVEGFIVETTHMRSFTAEELAANKDSLSTQVRNIRDDLLIKSDWTQLLDSPLSNKDQWAVYREALRLIPQQAGFPELVEWPVAP